MLSELFDEERLREEDNDALRAEGRAEGRVEGAAEEKVSLAINLICMGMGTLERISEATGLPLAKVQELAKGTDTTA